MFNNSTTDKSISIASIGDVVHIGEKIDKGIQENNSFFTGLWNNIKSNASSWISSGLEAGAKKGLEAIISKGGSVIGEAIGGLFNSLFGKKEGEVDMKVDLNLKATSTVNLTSTNISQGWSDVTFPIPGSSSTSSNQPIYNIALGVWNLKSTPVVSMRVNQDQLLTHPSTDPRSRVYSHYFYVNYSVNIAANDIDINPAIKDEFNISNLKVVLLEPEDDNRIYFHHNDRGIPYTILGGNNFYRPNSIITHDSKWINGSFSSSLSCAKINFKVRVSFDLVKKNNTSEAYTHSKIFEATNNYINTTYRSVWSNNLVGSEINGLVYSDLPANFYTYVRDGYIRY